MERGRVDWEAVRKGRVLFSCLIGPFLAFGGVWMGVRVIWLFLERCVRGKELVAVVLFIVCDSTVVFIPPVMNIQKAQGRNEEESRVL